MEIMKQPVLVLLLLSGCAVCRGQATFLEDRPGVVNGEAARALADADT